MYLLICSAKLTVVGVGVIGEFLLVMLEDWRVLPELDFPILRITLRCARTRSLRCSDGRKETTHVRRVLLTSPLQESVSRCVKGPHGGPQHSAQRLAPMGRWLALPGP